MKGWYCIYECSTNKWLMENQWWSKDVLLNTEHIATKWEADVLIPNYSMNGLDKPELRLIGMDYKDIAIMDKNHKTNPNNIMKFETMDLAEGYLLGNGFATWDGQFYSIRKIYF